MEAEYFKAKKSTHRFRENQKVWIQHNFGNHMMIRFKWRGSGRYVTGTIDKFATCVGEIKTIEVDEDFYNRQIVDKGRKDYLKWKKSLASY